MNIRDMQYLVAVADLHNFSQAAEKCFVSQPTLSGQIKKLEEQLDITLFERTNKRVITTQAGLAIVASARKVLTEIEHIKTIAAHAHSPYAGNFHLGAFPTLAPYIFPDLVTWLVKAMPKLRLILIEEKTESLIQQLTHGKIDAALLALPVENDYLCSEALFKDPFFLAIPTDHPLRSCTTIDPSQLTQYTVLLLEEGHCLRDQALELCQQHAIHETHDFRATSLETLRQMVKAGTGISLIPQSAIKPNEQGICYIPFNEPCPHRKIGLFWRKTSTRMSIIQEITQHIKMSDTGEIRTSR